VKSVFFFVLCSEKKKSKNKNKNPGFTYLFQYERKIQDCKGCQSQDEGDLYVGNGKLSGT
jgi:hypothetical protein